MLLAIGVRPDLAEALGQPPVVLKTLLPALVALAAGGAVLRAARPAAPLGRWPLALLGVAAIAALAVAVELVRLSAAAWRGAFLGEPESLQICLVAIPLMALPILAAGLFALRRGASLRPGRTGALAGLASGGLAAAIYAFHCIEDSPLFFAAWYSFGILVATGIGTLAGRRWLRW